MTDQELLQAIRAIAREEIQESEKRMKGEIQESEKRTMAAMKTEIQESGRQIMKDAVALMDAEFKPQFNLLAEELSIVREKVESLEKRVERIEDKVLEHDFKLRIIK